MVVSCESARQIVDLTIERMLAEPTMDSFRHCLATLTGGSGAIAVIVADKSLVQDRHDLIGGIMRSDTRWHKLCRWGPDTGIPATMPMRMDTDAVGVMEHGVELGEQTWAAFLDEMGWTAEKINRTICHQVGAPHRDFVLKRLGVPPEKDFVTYEFLGNIGTVSLPITAAIAAERGFLEKGHRTAFCGIGSGLNCLILGVQW
jgi:3-oxoacyl-[acyl-carrier-protein] synthase-3